VPALPDARDLVAARRPYIGELGFRLIRSFKDI